AVRREVWTGLAAGAVGLGVLTLLRTTRSARSSDPSGQQLGQRPTIVVLGAGFAGLTAVRTLAGRLAGRADIALVDRHNYHLFTPILYQVATCEVDPHAAAVPVRQLAGRGGIAFHHASVTGVDFDARRVQLDEGGLDYDYLVIALGTSTNFFHNQSAQEHALPLKWLEDGVAIRHRVIDAL